MKNSVVRLSLMGLLAGVLVTPALAHRSSIPCHKKPAQFGTVEPVHSIQVLGHLASSSNTALPKSTKTGSVLIADGPDPVPWPKKLTAEPQLIADGPDPVPWPKPRAMTAPKLLADGGNPIPWPKMPTRLAAKC